MLVCGTGLIRFPPWIFFPIIVIVYCCYCYYYCSHSNFGVYCPRSSDACVCCVCICVCVCRTLHPKSILVNSNNFRVRISGKIPVGQVSEGVDLVWFSLVWF